VKIFNAKADHDDEFREAKETFFSNEVEILKKLRHENLVKLWCVSTVIEPKMIVTEYIPNGSLLNYMRMGIGADFNFNDIIYVAAQVTAGMRYMEESRCVHRDLGARNIFVGENNLVKSKFLCFYY
jgi:serine/threonine protein kinase